ncbi:MAG: type II secretion system protein [Bacilli bacterium]|nr:type II secretion system protein [Bacilli bacterium]
MNKKGFTLVELLAVIVILSVIMTIGVTSFGSISKKARQEMVETKLDALETAAQKWGQEHLSELNAKSGCTITDKKGKSYTSSNCLTVTAVKLINARAYETNESDNNGKPTLKNNVTGVSMLCDTITIYKRNNRVYAITKEVKSNNASYTCNERIQFEN